MKNSVLPRFCSWWLPISVTLEIYFKTYTSAYLMMVNGFIITYRAPIFSSLHGFLSIRELLHICTLCFYRDLYVLCVLVYHFLVVLFRELMMCIVGESRRFMWGHAGWQDGWQLWSLEKWVDKIRNEKEEKIERTLIITEIKRKGDIYKYLYYSIKEYLMIPIIIIKQCRNKHNYNNVDDKNDCLNEI